MPRYRRAFVPGGKFFFTIVTHRRRPLFANPRATTLLGDLLRECQSRWPFVVDAIVLLPDHLHTIWSLPCGDSAYPRRIAWVKRMFTSRWIETTGRDSNISAARRRERRRSIWQPRYWEHTIADEEDLERHIDYIHWNPVKHGYVNAPADWPLSSFHRFVARGHYEANWGRQTPDFHDLADRVGEPP